MYRGVEAISSVSFSPGNYTDLVLGHQDGSIQMFNSTMNECKLLTNTHTGKFVDVDYAYGGKYIVVS